MNFLICKKFNENEAKLIDANNFYLLLASQEPQFLSIKKTLFNRNSKPDNPLVCFSFGRYLKPNRSDLNIDVKSYNELVVLDLDLHKLDDVKKVEIVESFVAYLKNIPEAVDSVYFSQLTLSNNLRIVLKTEKKVFGDIKEFKSYQTSIAKRFIYDYVREHEIVYYLKNLDASDHDKTYYGVYDSEIFIFNQNPKPFKFKELTEEENVFFVFANLFKGIVPGQRNDTLTHKLPPICDKHRHLKNLRDAYEEVARIFHKTYVPKNKTEPDVFEHTMRIFDYVVVTVNRSLPAKIVDNAIKKRKVNWDVDGFKNYLKGKCYIKSDKMFIDKELTMVKTKQKRKLEGCLVDENNANAKTTNDVDNVSYLTTYCKERFKLPIKDRAADIKKFNGYLDAFSEEVGPLRYETYPTLHKFFADNISEDEIRNADENVLDLTKKILMDCVENYPDPDIKSALLDLFFYNLQASCFIIDNISFRDKLFIFQGEPGIGKSFFMKWFENTLIFPVKSLDEKQLENMNSQTGDYLAFIEKSAIAYLNELKANVSADFVHLLKQLVEKGYQNTSQKYQSNRDYYKNATLIALTNHKNFIQQRVDSESYRKIVMFQLNRKFLEYSEEYFNLSNPKIRAYDLILACRKRYADISKYQETFAKLETFLQNYNINNLTPPIYGTLEELGNVSKEDIENRDYVKLTIEELRNFVKENVLPFCDVDEKQIREIDSMQLFPRLLTRLKFERGRTGKHRFYYVNKKAFEKFNAAADREQPQNDQVELRETLNDFKTLLPSFSDEELLQCLKMIKDIADERKFGSLKNRVELDRLKEIALERMKMNGTNLNGFF